MPFAIERGVTVTADAGASASSSTRSTSASATSSTSPSARDGWRAFAARDGRRAARRGVRRRPRAPGDHRRRPAGQRALVVRRARSGARARAARRRRPTICVELAKLCSRVENDWVGAETGLLDQLASLCSREAHVLRIDFRSLDVEPHPLDLGDWQLVTVDSGATHTHRRLAATTSAAPSAAPPARRSASTTLRDATTWASWTACCCRRVRHVVSENARVDATAPRARRARPARPSPRLLDESPRLAARRLRGVRARGRSHRGAPEGRRSRRRPDGRRRLRRFGAGATPPRGRPAGGCPRRRSPRSLLACSDSASSCPSGRVNAHSRNSSPKTSMPMPGEQVDVATRRPCRSPPRESKSPRMISSTPQATNTPPMMRRRSNRFAARSALSRPCQTCLTSYQNTRVRMAAPASTPNPSSFGDSHHA